MTIIEHILFHLCFHSTPDPQLAHACSVTQSFLTLYHSMDGSLPGSSAHGILQTRILEWVTISSSRGSSPPRIQAHVSCIDRRVLCHWTTRGVPDVYLVPGYSQATVAELSGLGRDCIVYKAEPWYRVYLCRKSLLTLQFLCTSSSRPQSCCGCMRAKLLQSCLTL